LDGNQLQSVSSIECEKDLYRPAVSPDGRSVATTISVQPAAGDRIIEFDGRRFSLPDSQIQLWDVSGPDVRELSRLTTDLLESIMFSPDGRMLIGQSSVEGRHLATRAVPVVNGQLVDPYDLPIRLASTATPAFSQDGTLMAVMNDSRELQIVDISRDAWQIIATLETGRGFYPGVAFSPNGRSIYVPIGCCLQRWDRTAAGGYSQVNASEAHSSSIGDIVFPGGDVLISTGREAICEWDLRRLESPQPIVGKAPQIPSGSQRLVAWPERDAVLFQSWADRNGIHLWDRSTGAVSDRFQLDFGDDYRNAAWCLALQPGGKLLATGHWDRAIRFWSLAGASPTRVAELSEAHGGHVCNVAFSPDGKMLASVGWDHAVKLWDMATDPPSPGGDLGTHEDIVRSVAFSPDGRWLASGDEKGVIRLWGLNSDDRSGPTIRHPEDLARVASPYDEQRTMNTLEFSADGRWLLSADGGGRVTVWSVPTGEIVKRWTFPGWVWAARWSPDQQLIATANQNGTVYLLVAPQP
jgi:WD40 repeat protein